MKLKNGDFVYQTDGIRIYKSRIKNIILYGGKTIFCTDGADFDETAINNSIFLTEGQASEKMKNWGIS